MSNKILKMQPYTHSENKSQFSFIQTQQKQNKTCQKSVSLSTVPAFTRHLVRYKYLLHYVRWLQRLFFNSKCEHSKKSFIFARGHKGQHAWTWGIHWKQDRKCLKYDALTKLLVNVCLERTSHVKRSNKKVEMNYLWSLAVPMNYWHIKITAESIDWKFNRQWWVFYLQPRAVPMTRLASVCGDSPHDT